MFLSSFKGKTFSFPAAEFASAQKARIQGREGWAGLFYSPSSVLVNCSFFFLCSWGMGLGSRVGRSGEWMFFLAGHSGIEVRLSCLELGECLVMVLGA